MKVHSLLKSLNNIDEEMIAEADRFATEQNLHRKGKLQHLWTGISVAAADSLTIAVAAADYTQDMVDYIEKEWMQPFESYRENVQKNQEQKNREDASEFIVMEPFQTWNRTPTKETLSDGYILPILCDNQVICTVALYQLENNWHYSISDDLCEELTALINSNHQAKITYCFDAEGNYTQTDVSYENRENDTARNIGELIIITSEDQAQTK